MESFKIEASQEVLEDLRIRLRATRWTDMPRGGHFPAFEEPALVVEDLRAFFREFWQRRSAMGHRVSMNPEEDWPSP